MDMKAKQLEFQKLERDAEIQRLQAIKKVDSSADIVKYLVAKEVGKPQIVQCGTMFSGDAEVNAKAE